MGFRQGDTSGVRHLFCPLKACGDSFFPTEFLHLLPVPWPLVPALFHPFVQQHESVSLPQQRLDPVPPPSAEHKQAAGKRAQMELLLHQPCQTIYPQPQVGYPQAM